MRRRAAAGGERRCVERASGTGPGARPGAIAGSVVRVGGRRRRRGRGSSSAPFCQSRNSDLKTGRSMSLSHSGKLPPPVVVGELEPADVDAVRRPISPASPHSSSRSPDRLPRRREPVGVVTASVSGSTSRHDAVTSAGSPALTNRIGPADDVAVRAARSSRTLHGRRRSERERADAVEVDAQRVVEELELNSRWSLARERTPMSSPALPSRRGRCTCASRTGRGARRRA